MATKDLQQQGSIQQHRERGNRRDRGNMLVPLERFLGLEEALNPYWPFQVLRGNPLTQVMEDFGLDRQLSEIQDTEEKFGVKLDVSQYKPEELEVTAKGNEIMVSGKHEERQDEHGFVSRQFSRRYVLPEGTDASQVASRLDKEGFLSFEVPKQAALQGARKIPIMQG